MNDIGYACKIIGVPGAAMRSCQLRSATPEKLLAVAADNIAALDRMVGYNERIGVKLFRISSDVIPLATHPQAMIPWRSQLAAELAAVGERIRRSGLRVSMHPGQYTVLNSPDEGVAARAVEDIVYHSQFLDALGVGTDAKIILHIGGVYGDKRAAMRRFASRFAALPAAAAGRVVLENDDVSYAIDDVHALAADLGLTVVMDVFHHALVPPAAGSTGAWLERSAATWRERDGRPKIHYSEQLPGGKPGMHSQTVDAATFAAFYREYAGFTADVMLEVKDKNLSAIKCLTCLRPGPTRPALTAEWARYKYTVLRHSQRAYREIRTLLKADQPDPAAMYAIIDAALATPPTPGSETNAAEHVWGYFKTKADGAERRRYAALLAQGMATAAAPMRRFLHRLADKYQEEYLQNSLYFYL